MRESVLIVITSTSIPQPAAFDIRKSTYSKYRDLKATVGGAQGLNLDGKPEYLVDRPDEHRDSEAKGMNAFKFRYAGSIVGHMYSTLIQDSFDVYNGSKGNNSYSIFLLLVVIDNDTLDAGFSLDLDAQGSNEGPVTLHASDFVYYDHPEYDTGRPSGYYSQTNPDREDLAYLYVDDNFDNLSVRQGINRGMVGLVAFTGVSLPTSGSAVKVDYEFEKLPATAVFSVYGYDDVGVIKYTNRAMMDNNNPDQLVSTFEVVVIPACVDVNHRHPVGDLSGDCRVNWSDFSIFAAHWLDDLCTGPHWCGGADLDGSGQVDWGDFAIFADHWLECTAPECN